MSYLPAIKSSFRRWGFALALAAGMIFFELAVTAVILWYTPENSRWLGANIINPQDLAVYLNYLAQSKDSFLFSNLFSDLPQIPRFDAFWSIAGLLTRTGLSPIWTHEILRWLCTLILAVAIFATARSLTRNEHQARVASLLMASGLSTGWLYDLWMGLTGRWTTHSPATADLASEFALPPILLGGAHIILSLALQILAVRWLWEAIRQMRRTSLLPAAVALFIVSSFHPYFIPLFGLISLMALLPQLKTADWKKALAYTVAVDAGLLPGAAYHVWLALADRNFGTVYLHVNRLPLDPWYFWLIMLLPFIPAVYWMLRRKIPQEFSWLAEPTWVWIWIISAIFCMILPFPWTRKYTQGLLIALVLLTLPFWLWLTSLIWTKRTIMPLKLCLLILVAFPFIHLYRTQAIMAVDLYWSKNFYRPDAVFQAWDYIRATAPADGVVLATDLWSGVWTPAYALRTAWIGHAHATPDYATRLAEYRDWNQTADPQKFRDHLFRLPINVILASDVFDTARVDRLIDHTAWHATFMQDGVSVWRKK